MNWKRRVTGATEGERETESAAGKREIFMREKCSFVCW